MALLDSYNVGDKLLPEDFSSPYYMPMGAYQYVEVTDIQDGRVQLTYTNEVGHTSDVMWVTTQQMERMLGWTEDPLIGADDDEVALYETQLDLILDESIAGDIADEDIVKEIQDAPTIEEKSDLELLDSNKVAMYVQKKDERVIRAWVFGSKQACLQSWQQAH